MKAMGKLSLLLMLLLLSACAISDLSMMQTAVPAGKGVLETSVYAANGMNLYPTQDFSEIYDAIAASDSIDFILDFNEQDEWIRWGKDKDVVIGGGSVNLGLSEKTDLLIRLFLGGSVGGKAGIKHLLYKSEQTHLAVLPAVSFSTSSNHTESHYQGEPVLIADDKSNIIGAELHLILTEKVSPYLMLSLSPHIALSRLSRTYNDKDYGPYNIPHGGLRGNMRIEVRQVFVSGEVGAELAIDFNNKYFVVPSYSLGVGILIGK